MAIVVNTNLTALKTQNNLTSATNGLNKALERMSSGYKINSSKDDAAGMFVAARLATQISGSKVAQSNIATGNNLLETAEGALDAILDNLNRIRDLAVQGANGVYDSESYAAMNNEITARCTEIERIASAAEFNGMALFSATGLGTSGLKLQVGAGSEATANQVSVAASNFTAIDAPSITLSATTSAGHIADLDTAIEDIVGRKAAFGAAMNALDSAQANLATTLENATAAHSTIMDADIAAESAEYTRYRILQQTSASLLTQANSLPSLALTLVAS